MTFHPKADTLKGWGVELARVSKGYTPEEIRMAGDQLVDSGEFFPKPKHLIAALSAARSRMRARQPAGGEILTADEIAARQFGALLHWLEGRLIPCAAHRWLAPGDWDFRTDPPFVSDERLEILVDEADPAAIKALYRLIQAAEVETAADDPDARDLQTAIDRRPDVYDARRDLIARRWCAIEGVAFHDSELEEEGA